MGNSFFSLLLFYVVTFHVPITYAQKISSSELNFSIVVNNVLKQKCLTCHSNAGGNSGRINLETYIKIEPYIYRIRDLVTNKEMPPRRSPQLTPVEYNLLIAWIDLGGPEL